MTCEQCTSVLTTTSASSAARVFTTNKCYTAGHLVYPSDRVYDMLLTCEDCFVKTIEQCMDKVLTLQGTMLEAVADVDVPSCHDVKQSD